MKKSWKLVVILSAVAVLLFAVGAYILVFRSGLTTDYYLSRGASALESEKYSRALRLYSSAVSLDKSNPEAYIGLAEAYKGKDNYTKAEYTLVSAITQLPEETSLYVALSRTYVEQEKFLDADRMLSRAVNEKVKSELAAMRPSAPTLSPESGYYSTYITVSASCSAGRIFLTTNGEYPAEKTDLYTAPIELPGGETTVCALVVDDSGLVSPVTYVGYTVAGVIEPVTISDPALDKLLRETLGKTPEDTLMSNELWDIEELEITGAISDTSQLRYLTGLKKLKIHGIAASDFTFLSNLAQLTELDLSGCVLSADSLSSLGKLTEITGLNLSGCAMTQISFLSGMTKLTTLDLSNNIIEDISPLESLIHLQDLSLRNNPITNLNALSACEELTTLDVSSCDLTSLAALKGKAKLTTLDASDNELTSISDLSQCENLQKLNVSSNSIGSISILPDLKSLTNLDCSYNQITAIPDLEATHPLQTINLNHNAVTKVSGLRDLTSLNYVMIDHNQVSDLSPLASCNNLVQVDAWENPISSGVSTLQEHSIIVNYNPN